jgi:ABC-type Mn2+/Zn2+ transport system permease subunit
MSTETLSLILALLSAATAGLVGAFALMKRMTLAGDVISHVALPGIGLALLFSLNPVLGGAATLLLGTVLIWHLEKRTGLATETTIGVIFAASLAIGALLTPSEELIEALFGGFGTLTISGFFFYAVLAALVVGFLLRYRNQLVVNIFSPELARTSGINTNQLNLLYLLAFSVTVILGLQFLGALLVGSLIIVPAAAARQLTHQLKTFLIVSTGMSIASVIFGFLIAAAFELDKGPVVVTVASALFALSLLKKKT